jgi:hypothetical protein
MRLLASACLCLFALGACEKRDTTPTNPPPTNPSPAPRDGNGNTAAQDQDLARRVRQAVLDDTVLASIAQNLQVTARSGAVTLRGTVKSQADKDAIASKARGVSGVQSVVNELTVSG